MPTEPPWRSLRCLPIHQWARRQCSPLLRNYNARTVAWYCWCRSSGQVHCGPCNVAMLQMIGLDVILAQFPSRWEACIEEYLFNQNPTAECFFEPSSQWYSLPCANWWTRLHVKQLMTEGWSWLSSFDSSKCKVGWISRLPLLMWI